jgi:Enoyl-CoA hydratase/isomerase
VLITDLELVTGSKGDGLVESTSVLQSAEPVVIEPRGTLDSASIAGAARLLRRLAAPTVLVGEPELPQALIDAADVCLTSVAEPPSPWVRASLDEVSDTVHRQPLAALSLVVLLRNTVELDTWSAISEESATYAMLLGSRAFDEWLASRGPGRKEAVVGPPVHAERVGDVLRLTLDRPETCNAIDSHMRDALVELLGLPAADPNLSVELRGNGPCFCAGGDLQEFGTVGDPATAHAVRLTRHPGRSLSAVASRTACYLHGPCIGAGVEIPAFASRVVAEASTTFCLPEVRMGLVPGAGGTVSIPRRIGRQRTAWLALSGATIDARVAAAWGLVDEIGATFFR